MNNKRIRKIIFMSVSIIILIVVLIAVLKSDERNANIYFKEVNMPEIDVKDSDTYSHVLRRAFIVYGGKVYYESGTTIDLDNGKKLAKDKVSVVATVENFIKKDEQKYSIIDNNIYSVKGYDDAFRVLMFLNEGSNEKAIIFENTMDININDEENVFRKMKIKNNITTIKWDTLNNYLYKTSNLKAITSKALEEKITELLYNSEPCSLEDKEFRKQFFYDEKQYTPKDILGQKILYLTLKDGTTIELRVYENGYVFYKGNVNYIYKADDSLFKELWDSMK